MPFLNLKLAHRVTKFAQSVFLQDSTIAAIKSLPIPVTITKIDHLEINDLPGISPNAFSRAVRGTGALVGTSFNLSAHLEPEALKFCLLPELSLRAEGHTKTLHKFVDLPQLEKNFQRGLRETMLPGSFKDFGVCLPIQILFPPGSPHTVEKFYAFFLFNQIGKLFIDYFSCAQRSLFCFENRIKKIEDRKIDVLRQICSDIEQSTQNSVSQRKVQNPLGLEIISSEGDFHPHILALDTIRKKDLFSSPTKLTVMCEGVELSGFCTEIYIHDLSRQEDPRIKSHLHVQTNKITGEIISVTANKTTSLALLQTMFARSVLYFPKPIIAHELARAAIGLQKLWNILENIQKLALVTRVFGTDGFLPQENMIAERQKLTINTGERDVNGKEISTTANLDILGVEAINTMVVQASSILIPLLERVASCQCTAHHRAVVIALLGDVGAVLSLTGATTGTPRSLEDSKALQSAVILATNLMHPELQITNIPSYSAHVKEVAGSEAIAPYKKRDRSRIHSTEPRTGIFNTGKIADSLLGVKHNTLPTTIWELGLINTSRLQTHLEPYAGHMSCSPSEILVAWELLAGGSSDRLSLSPCVPSPLIGNTRVVPGLDFSNHEFLHIASRSSAAAAFLVAGGFHSVLEVLSNILTYQGQDSRIATQEFLYKDASDIFGQGAATYLITEMFGSGIAQENLKGYLEYLQKNVQEFVNSSAGRENSTFKFLPFNPR